MFMRNCIIRLPDISYNYYALSEGGCLADSHLVLCYRAQLGFLMPCMTHPYYRSKRKCFCRPLKILYLI